MRGVGGTQNYINLINTSHDNKWTIDQFKLTNDCFYFINVSIYECMFYRCGVVTLLINWKFITLRAFPRQIELISEKYISRIDTSHLPSLFRFLIRLINQKKRCVSLNYVHQYNNNNYYNDDDDDNNNDTNVNNNVDLSFLFLSRVCALHISMCIY